MKTKEEIMKEIGHVIGCSVGVLSVDHLDIPEKVWQECLVKTLEKKLVEAKQRLQELL
ncbi:MAG: hypothetical protein ACXABY_26800 [Candidatus Thorarchaeota archaeon]|jgi:uncharacterized Rmd1/YagE family protein